MRPFTRSLHPLYGLVVGRGPGAALREPHSGPRRAGARRKTLTTRQGTCRVIKGRALGCLRQGYRLSIRAELEGKSHAATQPLNTRQQILWLQLFMNYCYPDDRGAISGTGALAAHLRAHLARAIHDLLRRHMDKSGASAYTSSGSGHGPSLPTRLRTRFPKDSACRHEISFC